MSTESHDSDSPQTADCPSATCSAILERIRVNDQFLELVNGLYCEAPSLFEGLRRRVLPLHADVNRVLRKMLQDSQQNADVEARQK